MDRSASAAAIAAGKEKVRQLKLLREQQKTSSFSSGSGVDKTKYRASSRVEPMSENILFVSNDDDNNNTVSPNEVAAVNKPKIKVALSTLVKSELSTNKKIETLTSVPVSSISNSRSSNSSLEMQQSFDKIENKVDAGYSTDIVISCDDQLIDNDKNGKHNIPIGFYDDPYEDMMARGLNVKEEIQKKEKHQDDELKSFFGEVQEVANSAVSYDEDNNSSDSEFEEAYVQLAYAAKTAQFIAKSEKTFKRSRDNDDSLLSNNEAFREIDSMIMTSTGLNSSSSINSYIVDDSSVISSRSSNNEVLSVPEKRAFDGPSPLTSNSSSFAAVTTQSRDIVKEVLDIIQAKRQRNASAESSLEKDDYVPLDYCNWTARTI